MLSKRSTQLAALLSGLLFGVPVFAANALGQFAVHINFKTADGFCISQSLSQQTGATVQVVCQTGQFVSITPVPGRPFLGTQGGAFRYMLGGPAGGIALAGADVDPFSGPGTVTSLRIYNASGADGPLELLVSF